MSKGNSRRKKRKRCSCCHEKVNVSFSGNGDLFISRHHTVFTKDGLILENDINLPHDFQKTVVKKFRNIGSYGANLCMSGNGHQTGCHNRFNIQIEKGCCGIRNIPKNGNLNDTRVLVGICPLISGKAPVNKSLVIPNKFCEFCFYFHAIFSPEEYLSLMTMISALPYYDGVVDLSDLYDAKSRLQKKGIRARKITTTQSNSVKRTRWKPVYKQNTSSA